MSFVPDQTYLTRDEVRHRLGDISVKTLQRRIKAGHFPRGDGRPPRWFVADVDTYLYLRGRGALPPPPSTPGRGETDAEEENSEES